MISGPTVTVNGAGTVVVGASQAEVSTYAAATARITFDVLPKPVPTLTLPSVATKTNGVGAFSVRASSNSSGYITYSILSGPATISGPTVTVNGAGTVVVGASQAEVTTYAAATAHITFDVLPKPVPTLTLPSIATKTNGVGAFSVQASSNSYGAITYSLISGPATISGHMVTVNGVGTVVINVSQAEITSYAAATANITFSVLTKPATTLTLPSVATKTNGVGAFSVQASSNSYGAITYSLISGPATISGHMVTVNGAGTVVVSASQAEVPTYAAATARITFDVLPKPIPTLTLPSVATKTNGVGAFSVQASSNSYGAITYSLISGPATISGHMVTVNGAGTVVVSASQAEVPTYAAATARITFDVLPKPIPTLTFPSVATKTNGVGAFSVQASSNSYGAITYSLISGPATISGHMVTVNGAGKVVVNVSQAEITSYAAATANITFSILPKPAP